MGNDVDTAARDIIKALLSIIPDNMEQGTSDWAWCWNELSQESQDRVKEIRKRANMLIGKDDA